jgi:HSP20 family molecular chaperone IbpA
VEETGEGRLRISLAVAGFSPADLSVTVEDNQLVVAGRREEAEAGGQADKAYLHRGIAARAFLRTFVLADGLEVTGALVEHGLLHVDLARKAPAKLVKRIPIKAAG